MEIRGQNYLSVFKSQSIPSATEEQSRILARLVGTSPRSIWAKVNSNTSLQFVSKVLEVSPTIVSLTIKFVNGGDAANIVQLARALRHLRLEDIEITANASPSVPGLFELLTAVLEGSHGSLESMGLSWKDPGLSPPASAIRTLREALRTCSKLEIISLSGQPGEQHVLDSLLSTSGALARLTTLYLEVQGSVAWPRLCKLIARLATLESIQISARSGVEPFHASIWDAIRKHPSVRSVECSLCMAISGDPATLAGFERALAENTGLEELSLRDSDLTNALADQLCKSVADGLLRNPRCRLRCLQLNDISASPAGLEHVGRAAAASSLVELVINADEACYGSEPCDYDPIAVGLACSHAQLETVRLGYGYITPTGLRSFGDALATTSTLRVLNLCDVQVLVDIGEDDGPDDIEDLSRGLASNTTLDELSIHLTGDFESTEASIHLMQALATNDTLRSVSIALPDLVADPTTDEAVVDMFERNRSIESFHRLPVGLTGSAPLLHRVVRALQARKGLRCIELKTLENAVDFGMALDIIRSCPCLSSLELGMLQTESSQSLGTLRDTVASSAPALGWIHGLDISGAVNKSYSHFPWTAEREAGALQWMDQPPAAGRACCLLRLLRRAKSLDPARVCTYAARALRHAIEARRPGDCITIAYGIIDCLSLRDRATFGLHPGASAGSGLFQAVENVACGRQGLRRDMSGGEWVGAAVRCTQVLLLEGSRRRGRLALWRRGVEAKRDAGMVFRAARDGRPLELGKRLRLGKLAGALDRKGVVTVDGHEREVSSLEAARLGGHDDCVSVLEECVESLKGKGGGGSA